MEAIAKEFANVEPNWGEEEVLFPGGIATQYIKSAVQLVLPGLNRDLVPADEIFFNDFFPTDG